MFLSQKDLEDKFNNFKMFLSQDFETKFNNLTVGIKEAAKFLGYDNTERLRQKVKKGIIPGFKSSNKWMFYVPDLIQYARSLYENNKPINTARSLECPSAKRKAVLTIIQGSQSVESECKNLRKQLLSQKRKNTKKNELAI